MRPTPTEPNELDGLDGLRATYWSQPSMSGRIDHSRGDWESNGVVDGGPQLRTQSVSLLRTLDKKGTYKVELNAGEHGP